MIGRKRAARSGRGEPGFVVRDDFWSELFSRGIGYVLAVGCDFQLTISGHQKMRAGRAFGLVEPEGWNRRSAGPGAKGPRYYDWAYLATASRRHHLLIRRSISDPSELAYHLAFVPEHYACSLTDLVRPSGFTHEIVFRRCPA